MTATIKKAFAVWFATIQRWDVKGFASHLSGSYPFVALKTLVRERSERVNLFDFPDTTFRILGVSNDGGIFHAYDAPGQSIHQPYKKVEAGDFFYNPYRVNVGSIGIVPRELGGNFASPAYVVFFADQTRIVPELLAIILKANWFNATLRAATAGSVRQNLTFDLLQTLEVPLPPLVTQQAILAEWQKARQAIAAAEERIKKIEAETERQFFAALGLKTPGSEGLPKVFAMPWTAFLRWSVSYNQTALTGMDITLGKYPVVRLGSVLKLIQYGTSEKANMRGQGVPVLRIGNIKGGLLDLTDLKHIDLPAKTLQGLLLKDGDILIIRTSGSRDLVGTCAVFHQTDPYIYASYLIRMQTDPAKADPDYVSWFINSPLGRQQVNAISRQIMQNNINSVELRSLQIPLPPLSIQRLIMEKVAAGRFRIACERETAHTVARQIEADMEAYLLGTKKVGLT